MTEVLARPRRLGVIGSIIGLVALVAAILPRWVLPVIYPPPPVDQVVVDVGHRIKDRVVARIKGVDYQPPPREIAWPDWLDHGLSIAAVSLGLLAIIFGVVAQLFREQRQVALMATTLGGFAIAVEFSFVLMGLLVLMAILYLVGDVLTLF